MFSIQIQSWLASLSIFSLTFDGVAFKVYIGSFHFSSLCRSSKVGIWFKFLIVVLSLFGTSRSNTEKDSSNATYDFWSSTLLSLKYYLNESLDDGEM